MSETRDIVERLRANLDKYPGFNNLNSDAATTIESLRATVAGLEKERDGLREALERLCNREYCNSWVRDIARTALGGLVAQQMRVKTGEEWLVEGEE